MTTEKLESWSRIIATIFIPITIAYMGNEFAAVNKRQESQARLVELATNILAREVPARQTDEQRQMRKWAVDVINAYSGVPMDLATQQALITTTSLPKITSTEDAASTWAVVFGADRSLAEAQAEVNRLARQTAFKTAQILLRSGSYRTVVQFDSRNAAEDALGQMRAIRSSSYVVDMNRWCPNSSQQKGYLDCKI